MRLFIRALSILLWLCSPLAISHTGTQDWYPVPENWEFSGELNLTEIIQQGGLEEVPRTGGDFIHIKNMRIETSGNYVLDFAHTVAIASFEHRIFNTQGKLLNTFAGGIESDEVNPFHLRHGRTQYFQPGEYVILTEVSSPYFITPPGFFIEPEASYAQSIKTGNTAALIIIGIFIALSVLYLCFAVTRSDVTDLAYAVFILGNLIFASVALNLLPDLQGYTPFELTSWPIFVSNIAYVVFVTSLLGIKAQQDPILHCLGRGLILLLSLFALTGIFVQSWAMELCRFGVVLFLCYGLACGIDRVVKGSKLARYYLLANISFVVPAALAVSSVGFDNPTIFSEHVGTAAVTIEVLLLSLVQSYRMNLINQQRIEALEHAEKSKITARTDALTGAPNRHAFEEAFSQINDSESFTYIDLDGLKYYNDHFGHHRGDELIRDFAIFMMQSLPTSANFYRIAGDEFGIISPSMETELVAACVNKSVEHLKSKGYGLFGASFGQASYAETDSLFNLKKIADARMYAVKERKKRIQIS